ncbi:hypothetical protein VPH35_139405 [Triticum aestivum]
MSNAFASSVGASGGGSSVSASAIVGSVIGSGSHFLRIEGYSSTKGLGNGRFIESESFTVGGHRWCLRYYPDSSNYHDSLEICIFLKLVDADANKVKAKFTMSLLDHNGDLIPRPGITRVIHHHTFSAGKDSTGVILIYRDDLERRLKEDAFVVRCDVTVVKEIFTKAIPVSEVFSSCRKTGKMKRLLSADQG